MKQPQIYFVQSSRSGSSWATNFLITDALGTFQVIPLFGSPIPSGEVASNGNSIYVRSNLIVAAYSPTKAGGIRVSILTNTGTSIQLRTNILIDNTVTLAGTPLIDVFIDNSMKIYVAYFAKDINGGTVKLAYSSDYGATWTIEDVESNLGNDPNSQDAHPSVYVDQYSTPHLAYLNYNIGKLRHAYKSGTTWVTETADTLQYNGLYSDIIVDTNNTIHISYHNIDQGDTMYSSKNGGWTRELIDYEGIAGYFTSIDVKSNEKAISYYNNVYNYGALAYYNGNTWRVIRIPKYTGMNATYGRYSGVRFTTDGNVWVGFVDGGNQLWVAKYLK